MRLKEDPVKDKRIVELNDIVEEVKESEEWEAVKMNILEIGIEKGTRTTARRATGCRKEITGTGGEKAEKGANNRADCGCVGGK